MANWRQLEAAVDRKIGRSFGERVRLKFNRNGKADPARESIEIEAVLHVGQNDAISLGPSSDRLSTRLSAGAAQLVIDRSNYSGPEFKVKDEVKALDRAGVPWFEVLAISDRHSNLIILSLGEAKS